LGANAHEVVKIQSELNIGDESAKTGEKMEKKGLKCALVAKKSRFD
jgi:hypothetical protein